MLSRKTRISGTVSYQGHAVSQNRVSNSYNNWRAQTIQSQVLHSSRNRPVVEAPIALSPGGCRYSPIGHRSVRMELQHVLDDAVEAIAPEKDSFLHSGNPAGEAQMDSDRLTLGDSFKH